MTRIQENSAAFERIITLCEALESATIPPRLRARLSSAFAYAMEKALVINFSYHAPDDAYVNRSIFRHAERGAQEYVP